MRSIDYPSRVGRPIAAGPVGVAAEERVLHRLSRSDGLTRRELSVQLGLPSATVISVATRLVAAGTLVERSSHQRRTTAGRHPRLLTLADRRPMIGTLVWLRGQLHSCLSTYGGRVVARKILPIAPRPTDAAALTPALDFLREDVPTLDSDRRPAWLTGVVISVPAPFQPGTGLPSVRRGPDPVGAGAHSEFAPWLRADSRRRLSEAVSAPVLIENDANLAALGEVSAGAARGHQDVVYVTLGDNRLGGGLVLSGALYRGASGFAGELAHIHVDDNGPLCACGGRGCLASLVGRGLLDSVQAAYETSLSVDDMVRMAVADEPGPARVLKDFGRIIGRRVADMCTILNPSAVLLGGPLGVATEIVVAGVREQIDLFSAPMASRSVRVMVGELGDRAELMGAIELARTELPST